MKNLKRSQIQTTSLTIFAMLFGAGNLIFPLRLGIASGSKSIYSFLGFALTGILLPVLGILAIVSFSGNYKDFFGRLGKIPGFLLTLFCMLIIGPFVVMPRIITLSYEMLQPFLPKMSILPFSIIFLTLAFFAACRPGQLLTVIGKVLSPLKVASLSLILLIGIFTGVAAQHIDISSFQLFTTGFLTGYQTLDLLGAIFFGSIIVNLLTNYASQDKQIPIAEAVKIAGISGLFGGLLLGLIYAGMFSLGAHHGQGFASLNEGEIFSAISFSVLGTYGAALIGLTVFLACFTTAVSLSAVVTDFTKNSIFRAKISFVSALLIVLTITGIISQIGLAGIIKYSFPVITTMYPLFVVITFCNIANKLWGFKYIKIPVAITAIGMLINIFLSK
ncbi:MAG: hypothetical protein UR14_C0003G0088 [candidate division TM6 bacterium GW2011_GWE2_31_21]|nr:MAG: hypothetical protein UR14_C0003G0088 [candidate division TM6 bacterium GW2011_GWE2_31_21]KKP53748.1 MAG: hypothetical protein UR43_C0003G0069 [candidate division TM6 bacterium GW2011_GWF2_33_332]